MIRCTRGLFIGPQFTPMSSTPGHTARSHPAWPCAEIAQCHSEFAHGSCTFHPNEGQRNGPTCTILWFGTAGGLLAPNLLITPAPGSGGISVRPVAQ